MTVTAPSIEVANLARMWAGLVDGHPGYVLTPGADAASIAAIQIVGQLGLATPNPDGTWTSTATSSTPQYADYSTVIVASAAASSSGAGGSRMPLLVGAGALAAFYFLWK